MGQSTAEVKRDIESTREEMSDTIDAITDRTSPSRLLGRQRQRMADRMRSVRSRVMGSAEQVVGGAQDAVHSATEGVRDVPDQTRQALRDQTQGNPLAAGVIAFGTGMLVAYLVPSSTTERRVTRQLRQEAEPVLDELAGAGREVASDLKAGAEQAAEDVKQRATESARQVADEAKDKAQAVRDDATAD
jgi:ElaB/YqjD/DUF883 family membrane-anchored ribosome-binding protein